MKLSDWCDYDIWNLAAGHLVIGRIKRCLKYHISKKSYNTTKLINRNSLFFTFIFFVRRILWMSCAINVLRFEAFLICVMFDLVNVNNNKNNFTPLRFPYIHVCCLQCHETTEWRLCCLSVVGINFRLALS